MDVKQEDSRPNKRKRKSRGAQIDGDLIEGDVSVTRKVRTTKSAAKSGETKSAFDDDPYTPDAENSDTLIPSGKKSREKSKESKPPAKEHRAVLNPPGANKMFYQQQAVQGRKKIKELELKLKYEQDERAGAEEKLAMSERQTLSRREEDLKDVQKEKLSVMDDTDVRSELVELMDRCKNFAKRWAQPGILANMRSPENIDAVYNMTCVKTASCRLISPEYGKLFAWDAGAARMLLESLLSHFVQHKVLERPFRLLARNYTIPEAGGMPPMTDAVLEELFSEVMDRSTTAAHLWRAQTVRALCAGEGGLVDLSETSKRVQGLVARFVTDSIEEFEKTAAPILTRRTNDAEGKQMIPELKNILSRAAALTPRLWLQNVHLQSWGCSGDDFRQTLDSRRTYLQFHNTMKHVPGDKKYDNLSMHIFTRPALLAHANGRVTTTFKVWVKAVGWRSAAEGLAEAKASWEAERYKLAEDRKQEEVREPDSTGTNSTGHQADGIRCTSSTDVTASAIPHMSEGLLMSTTTRCGKNGTTQHRCSPGSPCTPPLNPQSVSEVLGTPKSVVIDARRPASGTMSSIGSGGMVSGTSGNTAQPGNATSGVRRGERQGAIQEMKVAGEFRPASGAVTVGRSSTDGRHDVRHLESIIDLTAMDGAPSSRKE